MDLYFYAYVFIIIYDLAYNYELIYAYALF